MVLYGLIAYKTHPYVMWFYQKITVILSNWNSLLQKEFKAIIFIGDESEEQRSNGEVMNG